MASITLNKSEWLHHLGQFNSSMNDLKISVFESPVCIDYSAGYQTHYINVSHSYPDATAKAGTLLISDLDKACAFLKKCSGDVTLKQVNNGSTLYLTSGNLKMNLPITDIKSAQLVSTYHKLEKKAEESNWEKFGLDVYTLRGKSSLRDILKLATLKGLVDSDSDFSISANATSGEIIVAAGKAHDVKMFATSALADAEGPKTTVKSNFGPWLLPCLSLINTNLNSRLHFGEATGLVVRQADNVTKRLLIIIDQQE